MKIRAATSTTAGRGRHLDAFTLIEMIGVLAIIAILAALLLPKVAQAIDDSKINSTASSYQSVQAATMSHYGKYLAFNALFGTNEEAVPLVNFDTAVLMPEGFLDHAFTPKCGGPNAVVQVVAGSAADASQGYWFTGISNGVASTANYQYVVECILTNINVSDAVGISYVIDGPALTAALDGYADTSGKIVYNPTLSGGTLRMYVDGR